MTNVAKFIIISFLCITHFYHLFCYYYEIVCYLFHYVI